MLVPGSIVEQCALVQGVLHRGQSDDTFTAFVRLGGRRRQFNGVEGNSSVAVGDGRQQTASIWLKGGVHLRYTAVGIIQGTVDDSADVLFSEGLGCENTGTGEQWGDDFKGRVLSGGANEGDRTGLYVGQYDVLLRLVKAVNLVYEQYGALAGHAETVPGFLDDAAQVGDAGGDGGSLLEMGLGNGGDDQGKGGLTGTGRPPENHGGYPVGFYATSEYFVRADNVFLTHKLIEIARSHARSQGSVAYFCLLTLMFKEGHGNSNRLLASYTHESYQGLEQGVGLRRSISTTVTP